MRFIITMNMPTRTPGTLIHQIICDYPVNDLAEFIQALSSNDFILVDEYYIDPTSKSYYHVGQVAINYRYVGKVKKIEPNPPNFRPNND